MTPYAIKNALTSLQSKVTDDPVLAKLVPLLVALAKQCQNQEGEIEQLKRKVRNLE